MYRFSKMKERQYGESMREKEESQRREKEGSSELRKKVSRLFARYASEVQEAGEASGGILEKIRKFEEELLAAGVLGSRRFGLRLSPIEIVVPPGNGCVFSGRVNSVSSKLENLCERCSYKALRHPLVETTTELLENPRMSSHLSQNSRTHLSDESGENSLEELHKSYKQLIERIIYIHEVKLKENEENFKEFMDRLVSRSQIAGGWSKPVHAQTMTDYPALTSKETQTEEFGQSLPIESEKRIFWSSNDICLSKRFSSHSHQNREKGLSIRTSTFPSASSLHFQDVERDLKILFERLHRRDQEYTTGGITLLGSRKTDSTAASNSTWTLSNECRRIIFDIFTTLPSEELLVEPIDEQETLEMLQAIRDSVKGIKTDFKKKEETEGMLIEIMRKVLKDLHLTAEGKMLASLKDLLRTYTSAPIHNLLEELSLLHNGDPTG